MAEFACWEPQLELKEYRPKEHREYGKRQSIERILAHYPRPELGYRRALGVIRSGERYGAARLEQRSDRLEYL